MADTTAPAKTERSADFIAFYRPFVFEGKTYEGIDLAPVRDLTGRDLMDIDAFFRRKGRVLQAPEWDAEYIFTLAARACGVPFEFFEALPAMSAALVRASVQALFLGQTA